MTTAKISAPFSSRSGFDRTGALLFVVLLADVLVMAFSAGTMFDELEKLLLRNMPAAPPRVSLPAVRKTRLRKVAAVPAPAAAAPSGTAAQEDGRCLVLDDFSRDGVNRLQGASGVFSGCGGRCDALLPPGAEEFLELAYDVGAKDSYAGYWSNLNGRDLSWCRYLSFQVKGAAGNETCRIELGTGRKTRKMALSSVLPEGVSGEWRRVLIPLERLFTPEDLGNMKGNFAVVFEHSQGEPYAGTVYVRDISFVE